MALSKLEIQQMLREMNVKFDADESYEELKHRLQQENHSLWLKSVSGNRSTGSGRDNVIVRKRREKDRAGIEETEMATPSARSVSPTEKKERQRPADHGRRADAAYRTRSVEKPSPGQPWKPAADGTEPFNRTKNVFRSVLRRAKQCCERCGSEASEGSRAFELQACYIQPLEQGGEHSIKNMVALCPTCRELIEADPSAKEIKDLKRKTRSPLYSSLQVMRKKSVSPRHPTPAADRRKQP